MKREKKQMIPTEDGMKLITVLPDSVKSPKLTADWENVLTLVAKGNMDSQIKSMLEGKKTLVKGLKGKKGSYDDYLIPRKALRTIPIPKTGRKSNDHSIR